MSPEEPLNQQIPIESDEKSRLSAERERVVIRPREESPFKPPRINGNSKGESFINIFEQTKDSSFFTDSK